MVKATLDVAPGAPSSGAFQIVHRITSYNVCYTKLLRVGSRGVNLEGVIPDRVNWKSHNYSHLMEQPTLFYATVLILALMRERGVEAVAVEVSAQALSRHRVDGLVFDVAGFTNLSHDHLDRNNFV